MYDREDDDASLATGLSGSGAADDSLSVLVSDTRALILELRRYCEAVELLLEREELRDNGVCSRLLKAVGLNDTRSAKLIELFYLGAPHANDALEVGLRDLAVGRHGEFVEKLALLSVPLFLEQKENRSFFTSMQNVDRRRYSE